jgi:hypothetical protein
MSLCWSINLCHFFSHSFTHNFSHHNFNRQNTKGKSHDTVTDSDTDSDGWWGFGLDLQYGCKPNSSCWTIPAQMSFLSRDVPVLVNHLLSLCSQCFLSPLHYYNRDANTDEVPLLPQRV